MKLIIRLLKKIKHRFFDPLKRRYFDPVLPFLVVITGQKCTLKCRNCGNFSPYHSDSLDFYDIDSIISDLKKILKLTKSIRKVQIQGGDFFLHKEALKLLQYISKEERIKSCTIATNAIIIPKEEILEELKNNKFIVRISYYGTANEKNVNKLIQKLEEFHVNSSFHKFANGDQTWSDMGGINMPRHSRDLTVKNYLSCAFKGCATLENGIISRCSRTTVAHLVQNFELQQNDYVDVRSPNFNISSLRKFINRRYTEEGIVEACYYCNGSSGASIVAGEQLSSEEYNAIKRANKIAIAGTLGGGHSSRQRIMSKVA